MQHLGNRLGRYIALLFLSGCGGPASDTPSNTRAIISASVGGAGDYSHQATTSRQDNGRKVASSQAPAKTPLFADLPMPVSSDHDTAAASHPSTDRPIPTPGLDHEVRQQEAWSKWFEAARDSPDVSVRLQALETWAQRPSDNLDPITHGLVDQDETVRERAQELYTHQLQLEATSAAAVEKHEYSGKEQ